MPTETFMVHSITGQIISIDSAVMRRILTQAAFGLAILPDKTETERKAIEAIHRIQFVYPELI